MDIEIWSVEYVIIYLLLLSLKASLTLIHDNYAIPHINVFNFHLFFTAKCLWQQFSAIPSKFSQLF